MSTDPDRDAVSEMREIRAGIRSEMGGARKVEAVRAAGRRTVREHIDGLVDPGSFFEIGTFVTTPPDAGAAEPWTGAGDSRIGGHATIDGRPVTVCADDDTVKRGSPGDPGSRREQRLYEMATRRGNPYIAFGQTAGARLPDQLEPSKFALGATCPALGRRGRSIPVVSVIVGDSFGSSSFVAGLSDFVVQLEGTCLALTSPRVVEVATGEIVSMDDLGGPRVHGKLTGQIDRAASDAPEAYTLVRQFLSYLPSRAGGPLPITDCETPSEDDEGLAAIVPGRRTRAYDMRKLIARLVDQGVCLELKPSFAPNIVTALARVGGLPVGIIANQPMRSAGALTPDACIKAVKLICLCDAYGLPILFLQDTPGFLVGTAVEHDRALARSMLLLQALQLSRVPKCTVVVRKAFGLAFMVMGGPHEGVDLVAAWPGAEIGFMDPPVAANVLYGGQAAELSAEQRVAFLSHRAAELGKGFSPLGVASSMTVDEVIDPGATRRVIFSHLDAVRGAEADSPSILASWPGWF